MVKPSVWFSLHLPPVSRLSSFSTDLYGCDSDRDSDHPLSSLRLISVRSRIIVYYYYSTVTRGVPVLPAPLIIRALLNRFDTFSLRGPRARRVLYRVCALLQIHHLHTNSRVVHYTVLYCIMMHYGVSNYYSALQCVSINSIFVVAPNVL
jgi:hypothetical protein